MAGPVLPRRAASAWLLFATTLVCYGLLFVDYPNLDSHVFFESAVVAIFPVLVAVQVVLAVAMFVVGTRVAFRRIFVLHAAFTIGSTFMFIYPVETLLLWAVVNIVPACLYEDYPQNLIAASVATTLLTLLALLLYSLPVGHVAVYLVLMWSTALALYPFSQITPDGTPELARAARASVEGRENAPGGFEEGAWARNNFSGFYARLGDGEAAYRSLLTLFTSAGDRSLMAGTTIAPLRAYEMDYNTGATAAIAEMLVQSRTDAILILPALPPAWPEGQAFGLCARGGFVVSLAWRDGRPTSVKIHSRAGGRCVVRLPDAADEIVFDTVAGGDYDAVPGVLP